MHRRTIAGCSGAAKQPTAAFTRCSFRFVHPPRQCPPDENGDPSKLFFESAGPSSYSSASSSSSAPEGMYFPPTKELAEWRYALPALVFAAGGMPIFHIPPEGPLMAAGAAGVACSLVLRRESPMQLAAYAADAPALLIRDALAFTIGPAAGLICLVAFAWEPSIAAVLALLRVCRVPLGATVGAKEPVALTHAAAAWAALFAAFVLKWTLFEAVEPDEAAELEAARDRLATAAAAGGMDARLLGRVSQPREDEAAAASTEPPQEPPLGVFRPRSEHPAPADGSEERSIPTHGRLVPAEVPPHLKEHFRGGGSGSGKP